MNDIYTRTAGSECDKNDSETDMNENDRSRKGKLARVKRATREQGRLTRKGFWASGN